ncbi:FAD-binding domain-containing protein [Westerdykella ornata]|uniref:FAD-binding domain-containing protein n=1 Tax=Westerdykella ornata TaxID=318751 RepID=A0A6A6JIH3_WESOR|nr:FAD-binding domain-containing protein [Westerdykella ornata]KAF2275893.1 FAD-binding domain-containing protein [Westerdykella ornata]
MVIKYAFFTFPFLCSALAYNKVAADTCGAVGNRSDILIRRSLAPEYIEEQDNYWSTGCGAMKPSCILYPSSAEEVAAIVRVLNENKEPFVVKSGGHNPNRGFASIANGPLISTKYLNEVTFNPDSMTVRIGPGNDWDEVQAVLQKSGVAAVGGRIGGVGVGGYMLGGGLSFMSTEYGWAANNVVEFEVVLANASIVTASKDSHPDLFKALKGGGNNYGVVTAFTVLAHPQGQIWGGNLMFTANQTPALLTAIREFTENYPDEKAAIIMTTQLSAVGAIDMWLMFLFYDGPTPPPGTFDVFTNIGPILNNCKTRDYDELLTYNNFGIVKGSVYTITTETTPVPPSEHGAEVLGAYYNHWRNITEGLLAVPGFLGAMALQPIPKRLARKAKEMGGDLLDLDDDVDRLIIEVNYSYLSASDDKKIDKALQKFYKGTGDLIRRFQKNGKLPKAYLPLFANDGYYRQDYFGRLRTADFARRVRDRYDPEGFFATRTGGFKL